MSIEFWFEFGSTYSYLSAMRIESEAKNHGLGVEWKPFLLGPIFAKQGWNTSPFNIYPAKGRYMWQDLARQCRKYGLGLHPGYEAGSIIFPQNGLLAARVAITALEQDWGKDFCRRVFLAQFRDGYNISDSSVISECITAAGGNAEIDLKLGQADSNKLGLRTQVVEAENHGIFGAPSFLVGEELFWGDDRLEDALDLASR